MQKSKIKYKEKILVQLIKLNIKRHGQVSIDTKKIIFFMMKKIVIKGVNQFMYTNANRFNDTPYEENDIVHEIYFTFERCINNYDISKNKSFYLFFNSAVSRRMSRMSNYKSNYDPNHKKISMDVSYGNNEDGNETTLKDFVANVTPENNGSTDITDSNDLFYFGFEQIDINIMKSLYNKETTEFMMRESNLTNKELKERIKRKDIAAAIASAKIDIVVAVR